MLQWTRQPVYLRMLLEDYLRRLWRQSDGPMPLLQSQPSHVRVNKLAGACVHETLCAQGVGGQNWWCIVYPFCVYFIPGEHTFHTAYNNRCYLYQPRWSLLPHASYVLPPPAPHHPWSGQAIRVARHVRPRPAGNIYQPLGLFEK